ncbi:MAG: penicillin-binding protein 2 [Rickettsiales bacterium]|jgi:penicillin-binding protein 2|nr:penicillin-binding protein 2 [Rickettsiales bacterium]
MIDREIARTFDRRSALFLGAGTILTSALVLRMLQMQIFGHGEYRRKAENNSYRIQVDLPMRGAILAADSSAISRDAPIYRIYIIPEEAENLDGLIDIVRAELKLSAKRIEKIYTKIKKQRAFQPVLVSENSDWARLANLQAQNLPGLHIESGYARNYTLGPAGAQVFGYVGAVERPKGDTLAERSPFFTTGISGLEKSFNGALCGAAGQTALIANAVGRITGEDSSMKILPENGGNIKTSIRTNVQKILYDALALNKSGCGVAMDARTGEILAMVSAPSFDPYQFRGDGGDEYIAQLRNDPAKPFMNKAIEGLYPPGSTFKIVVALAALESGAISPIEKIHCPGHWEYGDHRYHCWEKHGHGWVDLAGALQHSCDVYFYQVALRIGIDAIKSMALRLGLSHIFMDGILPRETTGVIPDRDWKEKNIGSRWMHGDTIISGIGQGFILANCLQLCTMMARACTNTGVSPVLVQAAHSRQPIAASLGLQPANIKFVLNGLEKVLKEGGTASGSAINVNGKKMGGKTGTSQVRNISAKERESGVLTNEQLNWSQRNHGLFVAYAPTDNPKYAVAVITEHSGGSGQAARTAAAVMRELLKSG